MLGVALTASSRAARAAAAAAAAARAVSHSSASSCRSNSRQKCRPWQNLASVHTPHEVISYLGRVSQGIAKATPGFPESNVLSYEVHMLQVDLKSRKLAR